MPLSTHFVQAPGLWVLDRLGLGDRVRAVAPASRQFRFALDDAEVIAKADEGHEGCCVRRSVIDPWLQETAEESGATFLDRHRVVDVVRAGDRVVGVVAQGPSGPVTFHADLVVGADGPHSTIAKRTGVEEYLVTEGSRGGYWSYFTAPESWPHAWDSSLEHRGDELRYVFRCDGGLLAIVYVGERKEVAAWGRDYRARLMEAHARSETTRALTEGKEPVGATLGFLKPRFFYRRPVGPGFALVGDAGHFKDFVTGQGMTDAFLDAERLSRAILDGRAEAMAHYWRERDMATLPLHFDAIRQGEVGFNEPFMRWVISRVAKSAALTARLSEVIERRVEPHNFLPIGTMLGFMGSALVRGRFNVLSGFMQAGRRMSAEAAELQTRQRLLDEARAALDAAPAARRADARRAA
jgi:flavin-dependent dehydrogenase